MINLKITYKRLLTGDARMSPNEVNFINLTIDNILRKKYIDSCELEDVTNIIKISNLLYNNGANAALPLSDAKYDALLVLCRKQQIPYPVGAPPVKLFNVEEVSRLEPSSGGLKEVMSVVRDKDDMLFFQNIVDDTVPPRREDFIAKENLDEYEIGRKMRNVHHAYDMCGTLSKCKFVLNNDARAVGAFTDPTVQIFERDFLGSFIQRGIINQNNIDLVLSLKYDGISVEATVKGDTIIYACTRGDTANNEASDLTPFLGGKKFIRATGNVDDTETFGIKFEMIITYENLDKLSTITGKSYANARNAVIGIAGAKNARRYRDFVTLVPLESSLNIPREAEIEFLNKYYSSGITMRCVGVHGAYAEALYQVKRFVDESNRLRGFMNFQYDGVVAEFADDGLRKALGKKNAIPNYAIAIKFPPLRRRSVFTHYTFTVGKTGVITPMAHFEPVEFLGAIHDKTTIHSYRRFKDLDLRPGDMVDLTLNNDVIVYLTKDESQPKNSNPPEEFPAVCPSCGKPLMMSDSGDTVFCNNIACPEREINRVSDMLAKLNIKDFSVESIRALGVKSLTDLLNIGKEKVKSILGPTEADNLEIRLNELRTNVYPDFRIMGAIGFPNIGVETWKKILTKIKFEDIIKSSNDDLEKYLSGIAGIGPKTRDIILKYRPYFMKDMQTAFNCLHYKSYSNTYRYEIRITGFRDQALLDKFNNAPTQEFNATDGSVTNSIFMLIVPYEGFVSSKVERVFRILDNKLTKLEVDHPTINWNTVHDIDSIRIYPIIMTPDKALEWLDNYIQNKVQLKSMYNF